MAKFTEGNNLSDVLLSELDPMHCREVGEFSADAAQGAVLGKASFSCPATGTAAAGNHGNGTLGSVVAGDAVELGVYTVECTATASNAGTFKVLSPSGARLDDAETGEAYDSPHLAFAIADGGTDFAVGDAFAITVAKGNGKYKPVDFTAHDGTQLAAGIALYAVDVSEKAEGTVVHRNAVVIEGGLVWPTGATSDQKAAALAQLETRGIDAVTGV